MQCPHCMRGEAECVDLQVNTLEKVFQDIARIGQLTLTGGEPSLVSTTIDWIVRYVKAKKIPVGNFFCATNGYELSEGFIRSLDALYDHCDKKAACSLSVSIDQFHADADPDALAAYRKLPYYKAEKEKNYIPRANIISEGRAAKNRLGRFKAPMDEFIYDYALECFRLHVGDRIYINAIGQVLLTPDLSYETQKDSNIGSVHEKPLSQIILDNAYKVPEHFYPEKGQCFYCVHINAEAKTIAPLSLENRLYYPNPQRAMVAYANILHNMHYTPINPQVAPTPENLELRFVNVPPNESRCCGTCVSYIQPGIPPKHVMVTVERCMLEEGGDHVRV